MSNGYVISQATAAEVTDNNQQLNESDIIYFQMIPKTLLDPEIQKYPPDQQSQEKLFRHIIQYRNQSAWKEECLCPQSYLDFEISDDHHNIVLNISTEDITLSVIMGLSGGDAASKRLANRKQNLVDADINAWICLVNSPERLILTKEWLQLVAALAELQAGKLAEK